MQYWKPSAKKKWIQRKKEEMKREEMETFQRWVDHSLAPRRQQLEEWQKGYVELCKEAEQRRKDHWAFTVQTARKLDAFIFEKEITPAMKQELLELQAPRIQIGPGPEDYIFDVEWQPSIVARMLFNSKRPKFLERKPGLIEFHRQTDNQQLAIKTLREFAITQKPNFEARASRGFFAAFEAAFWAWEDAAKKLAKKEH